MEELYKFFFLDKDTVNTELTYILSKTNLFKWFNSRTDLTHNDMLIIADKLRGHLKIINENTALFKLFREAINNNELKMETIEEKEIVYDMSDNTLVAPINYIAILIC